MIPNIAELVGVNTSKFDIFTVILSINHILLTINASVNYIIYLLLCGRGQQNSTGNYNSDHLLTLVIYGPDRLGSTILKVTSKV